MQKYFISGVAVLFLLLACSNHTDNPNYPVQTSTPSPDNPLAAWENTLHIGDEAPGFILKDLNGTVHRLSDYRGQIVILDFWATSCKYCLDGMPTMQYLHETYTARGLAMIGLNSYETGSPAAFLADHQYTYTNLLNAEEIGTAYGICGLPSLLILDPAGIILEKHLGWWDESAADLETAVQGYLAEYFNNG